MSIHAKIIEIEEMDISNCSIVDLQETIKEHISISIKDLSRLFEILTKDSVLIILKTLIEPQELLSNKVTVVGETLNSSLQRYIFLYFEKKDGCFHFLSQDK